MAIDHNGNVQRLAEVIENDCRCSCIGAAVTAAHRARLIQKEANSNLRNFIGKVVLVEYLAVIPAQRVCIQTAAHHQTRLLSTPLLIF